MYALFTAIIIPVDHIVMGCCAGQPYCKCRLGKWYLLTYIITGAVSTVGGSLPDVTVDVGSGFLFGALCEPTMTVQKFNKKHVALTLCN